MRPTRLAAAVLGCLLFAACARADTAAPATWNDALAPLAAALQPLAAAALTAIAGLLARAIVAHLKLAAGSAQAQLVTAACQRAAGIAYQFIVQSGGHVGDAEIRNVAVARALGYVSAALPGTIAALGLTPERLTAIIEAEFGKLLALDPTVSIAPPPPAPVPAPVVPPGQLVTS